MPHILSRSGPLFATHAINGAPISPGRIIIAPPNYHLALERNMMRVLDSARENGQRPSIDVLFRSAANAFGDLVCGVLLSGTLDDGVAGMQAIRNAGGVTIAQEPSDALFADMPRNAIIAGAAQITAVADELGTTIVESVHSLLANSNGLPVREVAKDERENGKPSMFTCPDCGGTLWESDEHGSLRFRCRTGHAYNVNAIMDAQHNALENSLWTALRIIEERVDFYNRMSRRARERGDRHTAERFAKQADELVSEHDHLRQTLADVVIQPRSTAS